MEKVGENDDVTSQLGLLSVNRLAVCQTSHSNGNVNKHNFMFMKSRQNVSRLSLNPISDRAVVVLKAKTDFYQFSKLSLIKTQLASSSREGKSVDTVLTKMKPVKPVKQETCGHDRVTEDNWEITTAVN